MPSFSIFVNGQLWQNLLFDDLCCKSLIMILLSQAPQSKTTVTKICMEISNFFSLHLCRPQKAKSSKKKSREKANKNRNNCSAMDMERPEATIHEPAASPSALNPEKITTYSPSQQPTSTSTAAMDVEPCTEVSAENAAPLQDKGRHSNRGKKWSQRSRGRGGR